MSATDLEVIDKTSPQWNILRGANNVPSAPLPKGTTGDRGMLRNKRRMFGMDEKKYKEQRILRDMIDGELNRIAVTDSKDEIKDMVFSLVHSISSYSTIHICRIYDESGEFDVKS